MVAVLPAFHIGFLSLHFCFIPCLTLTNLGQIWNGSWSSGSSQMDSISLDFTINRRNFLHNSLHHCTPVICLQVHLAFLFHVLLYGPYFLRLCISLNKNLTWIQNPTHFWMFCSRKLTMLLVKDKSLIK